MRRALFVLLSALVACSAAPKCPEGSKASSGACVRTVVETRVVCPTGSRFSEGHCIGEEVKAAKVDFSAAFLETFDAKAIQERLMLLYQQHQKELDEKAADIAREKEAIERDAKTMTREQLEQRSAAYEARVRDVQKLYADYQKELNDQSSSSFVEGLERVRPALKRYAIDAAKAEGFSAVFDACTTNPPGAPACDATKPFWTADGVDVSSLPASARWDLTPSVVARYRADVAAK